MAKTFLMTPSEHRNAALRLRAMKATMPEQAERLEEVAASSEMVARMIENRVAAGTHWLPFRPISLNGPPKI
jgi:hypothetical protein